MLNVKQKVNWLAQQAKINPGNIFLKGKNNRVVSFSETYGAVLNFAGELVGETQPNKFVPLLCENNIDFVFAVFALWQIGAVPVPLNYKLHKNEIKTILSQFDFDFLLVHKNLKKKFDFTEFTSLYFPFEKHKDNKKFNDYYNSTAVIIFTSGSRGKPKGVKISFKNLYASAISFDDAFQITPDDELLASLPFYHIGGFSIITRTVLSGAQIIFPESSGSNDIQSALNTYRPTMVSFVPTMLKRLTESDFTVYDKLRYVFLGGASSSKKLIKKALGKKLPVTLVYGSTETSSMIAAKRIESGTGIDNYVIPMKNVNIQIINNKNVFLKPNEKGEILISAPQVAEGYLNPTADERNKLKSGTFHSGDFGYLDENGNLHILGRSDDIIISGGENINPAEIEEILLSNPEIRDAYVFGEQNEEWGEQITAAVVKHEESDLDGEKTKYFLQLKLSSFKIPKKIYFVKSIPRSSLGKVLKPELEKLINPLR